MIPSDKIFEGTKTFPDKLKGGVVVIGNFDGVHLGHQAVLQDALDLAKKKKCPAIVLTFEPHPRTFFRPEIPVFRLTPPHLKADLLIEFGFDAVVSENFDKDLANLEAEEFISKHLVENLQASHVVIGFNFHFGKNRRGTPELLVEEGEKAGFGVTRVQRYVDAGGERVSSSRIRNALEDGDIARANILLGRCWRARGQVVKGAQLGRTLGYPTANIKLHPATQLRHGIYAVRLMRPDGSVHDGVASYGKRPTFDNGAPLLETFIFDFSGDIYGEFIAVDLVGWIRAEEKFESAEALVVQMDKDSLKAKEILSENRT
ncbi:MAG: bifunctional riboflavin kinase/FAD synthetase [Salaquimonas sp.]